VESALREDLGDPPALSELVIRFPALAASLQLQVAFRDGLRQATAVRAVPEGAGPIHFAIKGYEIGRVIGRGGMATVYEARQLGLNRRVALKMLSVGPLSDPQHLGRLKTEAEAVSRLQHPNVVQIHEVGTYEGQPFLALELVEGGTLADRLRNGSIPPLVAAELIETLARAVYSVHEHGIVHRDIKPANVLFTLPMDGASHGIPKLSDFGLAKLTDGTSHPTRTGETLGTPAYMAPEQVVGSRDVGPTTDVYGLGAVFYECLTGQPPFRGGNVAEAMFRVSQHDPIPPSRLQPGVPRDLQTICLKCLEKSPKKRYQSAAELADDLGRFRRGEPVHARPLGSVGRVWKQVRRRPLVAALFLSLIVTVIAGLLGVTWKWREANWRADGEAKEREKAEIHLYRSRVSQAALLWQSNNIGAAKELLAECVPAPGQPDYRGWEWNYLSRLLEPEVATLHQRSWVRELAVSPDGHELAIACGDPLHKKEERGDGELVLIDLDTHTPVWQFSDGDTVAVAYSPDGRFLASATANGNVRVFDRSTRREQFVWRMGQEKIGLCFHPDSRYLAIFSGLPTDRLVVRDLQSGEEVAARQIGSTSGLYPKPSYSPDGQRIIAVQPNKTLQLWNPLSKQEQDVGDGTNIQTAAFLGSNHLVTVGDAGGAIWDLTAPKSEPRRLFGHTGMVCAVAVHPNGTLLATGGTDHTVRIWDARTAREILVLRGHTWTVQSVVFTPDGKHIISGGQDKTVKIWDATRNPRGRLFPPTSPANAVWVNASTSFRAGRTRRSRYGTQLATRAADCFRPPARRMLFG
jgi:WD40 repeat protein/tRNA A-37 threonylcarbamoyl transferase component Bud32